MESKKFNIKQVWIPYYEWEDFLSGMWRKIPADEEDILISRAVKFTGDHIRYGNAMSEVIKSWPQTMLNSLTNPSINKRAFLGHCAVQFKIGIPEYITRRAWGMLSDEQRMLADNEAQNNINNWLENYASSN